MHSLGRALRDSGIAIATSLPARRRHSMPRPATKLNGRMTESMAPLDLRPRNQFATIADAERLAQRRLPRVLFDAIISGSGRSVTLRANRSAFDDVLLRPRAAVTHPQYHLGTTVAGTNLSLPVITAPTSMSRLIHPEGELGVARGVSASQSACVIGWVAGYGIEEIAAVSSGPLWQNVIWRMGREGVEDVIERSTRAGYKALVATIDLTISPGAPQIPPVNLKTAIRFGPQVLTRPGWLLNFIRDGMDTTKGALPRAGVRGRWVSPAWADLAWIRENWSGGFVIKGVLSGEDARRALDVGADAIVVSNHGGKGVDGVPATLRLLPEIVAAVNGQCEVLIDGGIRQGSDVIKALAMGAKAVLIGRPYLFGLAIAGAAGVHRVLEVFRTEIEQQLAMLGCASVKDLDASYVRVPKDWSATQSGRDHRR
jgi:pre-mycofactocin synthase